jgi:hypothetical protein
MEQYFLKPAQVVSPEKGSSIINMPPPKRDTQVHDKTQ